MNDEHDAEESSLTSAASSISRGHPVDWDAVGAAQRSSNEGDVLAELKALETLAQLNTPVPATWGPFVISCEIGHGAFGVVYRALDPNLEIELALKVIKPTGGKALDLARALSEARRLAQIVHPNVVRVFRAERIADEVGVAMELIKGDSLATVVRQQGPRSAREAMLIAVDLCQALAAVHGANILHGDIKAHNVMRAEGGRTVLMDFGSARNLTLDRDDYEAITGTPLYLAPEVFAGAPRTRASDIYSLGVLLYFLTTAEYPVGGTTRTEVEQRHADGTPHKPLRDVRPDLPDAFIRIVDRALAQRPEDRHQSAGALEADLSKALGLDTHVPPEPWPWPRLLIAATLIGTLSLGAFLTRDWLSPSAGTRQDASSTAASPGPAAAPASSFSDEYRIHAALYREHDGQETPLLYGGRVSPGDKLSLRVTATAPIYVYVVNEDDQGESWLLFPLDPDAALTPLPAGQRHRLPGALGGEQVSWQVTSRGGREHFLLFASRQQPSPAFAQLFAELPRPQPGKAVSYQKLSDQALLMLRGIGGISATRDRNSSEARLLREFTVPLGVGEETVRGPWVRQLTLENP